jgi:hypothetical protein
MSQSGRGTGSRSHREDRSSSDKGRQFTTLASHIFCGLVGALFLLAAAPAHAEQFLPDLIHSSTVPANGDLNPYGVAFVPSRFPTKGSKLNPGDVLVSNFNNSSNLQGTGTTIISLTPNGEVAPSGTASVFFQGSGLGLTTALGVLQRGFVVVGNVPTKDGSFATIQPGSLLFLDRQGHLISPSPYTANLDGPWDLTVADGFNQAKIFVSNVLNGTVTRLDVALTDKTVTVTRSTVIATGYTFEPNAAALVLGPTGLAYDAVNDLLYIASTADNAIFVVPQAGARTTSIARGKIVFQDPHLRGPLALAFAPNGHLLTSNGDAVNPDPAEPSEIVEFTTAGAFVAQFNVDAGQGGAFGLALAKMGDDATSFAAVDDNTSELMVLKRQ